MPLHEGAVVTKKPKNRWHQEGRPLDRSHPHTLWRHMDAIDQILEDSHSAKMHAIVLASLRYAQYLTAFADFSLSDTQQDICGYADVGSISDGDYENAVTWLESVSDATPGVTPTWQGNTN